MFNLLKIKQTARELAFTIESESDSKVEIRLTSEHVLSFENTQDDTMIFFDGGWHSHGDIFADLLNKSIDEVPSELLRRFKKGKVLLYTYKYANGTKEQGCELIEHISDSSIKNLEVGETIEYTRVV